jgi:hypothetical protein
MKHTLEAAGYRFIEVGPLGNEVWCWEFSENSNTGITTKNGTESAL